MLAKDVMTTAVVSVTPETPTRRIAEILVEHGISAVPVLDAGGAVIGMVSEGDLINRGEAARTNETEARNDWWLTMLAEGETLDPAFVAALRSPQRTARQVMVAPVVTVEEDTDVAEVARLLVEYRIKRVPVVRDGAVVGIVSRADLLHAVASRVGLVPPPIQERRRGAVRAPNRHPEGAPPTGPAAAPAAHPKAASGDRVAAADFRALVDGYQAQETARREAARNAGMAELKHRVSALIDTHVSEEAWRTMLHGAREAAEHGLKEYMVLRFPSQLCSDGGRAINARESDWPTTLRGEAAEIYLRWERDLKPHGFHLSAQVLSFPDGFPGDVGLSLSWGG